MVHGDDSGLILPPKIAPIQTVIVPISRGNWKDTILPEAEKIRKILEDNEIRVFLDDRDTYTPGWKFSEWEMRGVPVRIEIGPKDIEKNEVVLVNRIDRKKDFVKTDKLVERLTSLLDSIQNRLFKNAENFKNENTRSCKTIKELTEIISEYRGYVKTGWCGSEKCESDVKERASATIRVILDKKDPEFDKCAVCNKPANYSVIFAKSY